MKKFLIILSGLMLLSVMVHAQDTLTKKELRKESKSFLIPGRPWTVEIPLWIPGFSGSAVYGDISIEGEDGQEIENPIEPPYRPGFGDIFSRIFTTKWYLKLIFMTRIVYEKNRFIAQMDGFIGRVGESTEFNYNNKQVVQANFQTLNVRLFGGYKLINANSRNKKFRYELFGYLGVRLHFQKIYSDLDGLINKLDINPVWAEPIIGLQNQFTWKRWFIVLQGDYGGYFIEDKYSFLISSYVYFRSGKVTSLKMGWNHLDLNQEGTFVRQDYNLNITLSGPMAGIAFHF